MTAQFMSFVGIGVLVGIGWLCSNDRAAIRWRPVLWGIALQLALAVVVLSPVLQDFFFDIVDGGVRRLLSFAEEGMSFVFQTVEPHQILSMEGESETFIGRV